MGTDDLNIIIESTVCTVYSKDVYSACDQCYNTENIKGLSDRQSA